MTRDEIDARILNRMYREAMDCMEADRGPVAPSRAAFIYESNLREQVAWYWLAGLFLSMSWQALVLGATLVCMHVGLNGPLGHDAAEPIFDVGVYLFLGWVWFLGLKDEWKGWSRG